MSKIKYGIMIASVLVLLLIAQAFFGNKSSKNKFEIFYNAEMKGKLTRIDKVRGATTFEINNINKQFLFWPNDADNKNFPEFALPGDSIYKPAKSDTLKLVHHGKMYLFTFEKF